MAEGRGGRQRRVVCCGGLRWAVVSAMGLTHRGRRSRALVDVVGAVRVVAVSSGALVSGAARWCTVRGVDAVWWVWWAPSGSLVCDSGRWCPARVSSALCRALGRRSGRCGTVQGAGALG